MNRYALRALLLAALTLTGPALAVAVAPAATAAGPVTTQAAPAEQTATDGADGDADGVPDEIDGCPEAPDATQADTDGDKVGDACDPLVDVSGASPFAPFISTLVDRGITTGCGGTSALLRFCPTGSVSRGDMAIFLLRSAGVAQQTSELPAYSGTFGDVPESAYYARWVEELARRGVTAGCGTSSGGRALFCPDGRVTRGDMAVFLLRASGAVTDPAALPAYRGAFDDVPSTIYYARWVEELARRGVTAGCGVGLYCPTTATAREQMSVFLSRSFSFTGSLDLAVAGLPAGLAPQVLLAGPGSTSRVLTAAGRTSGLAAGRYTVQVQPVRSTDASYGAVVPDLLLDVTAGPTPTRLAVDYGNVVPDSSVELPAEDVQSVVGAPGEPQAVVVTGQAPAVGEVLTVGVSARTPDGLLGTVTGVRALPDGSTEVQVQPAALQDLADKGDIQLVAPLSAGDVMTGASSPRSLSSSELAQRATTTQAPVTQPVDKKVTCSGDASFTVTGSISITPTLEFSASWGGAFDPGRVDARMVASVVERAGVAFEAQGNGQCALSEPLPLLSKPLRFRSITIPIAGYPVVIVPSLQIYLLADGSIAASLTGGVTQSFTARAGLAYENGVLRDVKGLENTFTVTPPTLNAEAHAQAALQPELMLSLYGVAGPSVVVGARARLAADVRKQPWWTVTGQLYAGAALRIPKLKINKERPQLLSISRVLASAPSPPPQAVDAAPLDMSIPEAGGQARADIVGKVGQRLGAALEGSTYGSSRLQLVRLRDGVTVASGSGAVPDLTARLTEDGAYRFIVTPDSASAGTGRLWVTTERSSPVAVDGPALRLETTRIGATASGTFTGSVGERLGIALTASDLANGFDSADLRLVLDRTGGRVASDGFVEADGVLTFGATLPESGAYRVVLDPDRTVTGSGLLHVSREVASPLELDGPGLTLAVSRPGATAAGTFTGKAGERLGVSLSGSDLANGFDSAELRLVLDRTGGRVASDGFVEADGVLTFGATLPESGAYRVVLDPEQAGTGRGLLHASREAAAVVEVDGPGLRLDVTRPGATAAGTFTGTAGERLGVALTESSLPNGFDSADLRLVLDRTGTVVASDGFVEADGVLTFGARLPETGAYRVVLDPDQARTGAGLLTVSREAASPVAVDGAALRLPVTRPGATAAGTFSGRRGERLGVALSDSSFPDGFGHADLELVLDRTGSSVASDVHVQGGVLSFNATLPEDGSYRVVLDPEQAQTGSGSLTVSRESTVPVTVDGPGVRLSVDRPGATAAGTFTGAAGARLTATLGASTFPDGFGQARLALVLDRTGTAVASDVDVRDGQLSLTATLPEAGAYRVVLDPEDARTGAGTLTVARATS